MNISVIGTGYVGLVTGACLAEFGMNVLCADIDEEKISKLKRCVVPIYEPGLENIIKNNVRRGTLKFTTDIRESVEHAAAIFICVGTPTLADGSTDLQYVFHAAKEIARYMEDYKLIINKSTVPVGTGRAVKDEVNNILLQRNKSISFDVVSNPEFLREGMAVKDFINPDRIAIGAESTKAVNIMKEIYNLQILHDIPFFVTGVETAEMIKYASNAFLATRISFINEIANMCECCGADISVVSKAMGMDSRIGAGYLNPGPGFGGSCLPKDAKALLNMGKALGYTPRIVKSVLEVNGIQKKRMLNKIKKAAGKLKNKTITILGIAFKPETDDIRESPAIAVIEELLDKGATVKVYDPKAMPNAKKSYPLLNIHYCDSVYSACRNSDCIVLFTEWEQFRHLDFKKLKSIVNRCVFIDLRNMYEPEHVKNAGFVYQGVGRK
ncbi:MAG: UDP-glucose/GDP-mannose dehydrogenase family protein [Clostridiales bacterium]|jgi:UDPglucose 6-dehydrogenase|nr:UDP-glucose/GDP-mannose dehydrogenase family protein [Eubacteriales bacterium]MDH7565642.1 UDP-glucose/GDP-mannose dehydrogenase family protein [Clostridiales bacterium]